MKSLAAPTAKAINEAHKLAHTSAETAIEHGIRCGQLLVAKKAELAHGEFESWIEKHCEFSPQTARRYMQVASKTLTRERFDSLRQALGYDKAKPKKDSPKGAVPVVKDAGRADDRGHASTGETGKDRPAAPVSKPEPPTPIEVAPDPGFDFTGYDPEDDDDYKANIENVMMADDKLAAMREQLKQCHREIQALKSSRDHYQNEAGSAVRLVKARDREIERLKKELAKRGDRP
jgi:hypothetical protein